MFACHAWCVGKIAAEKSTEVCANSRTTVRGVGLQIAKLNARRLSCFDGQGTPAPAHLTMHCSTCQSCSCLISCAHKQCLSQYCPLRVCNSPCHPLCILGMHPRCCHLSDLVFQRCRMSHPTSLLRKCLQPLLIKMLLNLPFYRLPLKMIHSQ